MRNCALGARQAPNNEHLRSPGLSHGVQDLIPPKTYSKPLSSEGLNCSSTAQASHYAHYHYP